MLVPGFQDVQFHAAVDPGGGHGADVRLEENDNDIRDMEFNNTSGKETKLDNGEMISLIIILCCFCLYDIEYEDESNIALFLYCSGFQSTY